MMWLWYDYDMTYNMAYDMAYDMTRDTLAMNLIYYETRHLTVQ